MGDSDMNGMFFVLLAELRGEVTLSKIVHHVEKRWRRSQGADVVTLPSVNRYRNFIRAKHFRMNV